jgi:hypothetical protein
MSLRTIIASTHPPVDGDHLVRILRDHRDLALRVTGKIVPFEQRVGDKDTFNFLNKWPKAPK